MFMGEFSHTIDAKGRLIIPTKFREKLGEQCVITQGLDNCLTVYTMEGWEKFSKKLAGMASTKANVRAIKRFFVGGASEVEFDKQGRILIPANLREHADLIKEAVVVGVADRIEIWSREGYENYMKAIEPEMESLAESLDGFDDL